MEKRDYDRILRIDCNEFVTALGTRRARVREYPKTTSANADLSHLKIEFVLQASDPSVG